MSRLSLGLALALCAATSSCTIVSVGPEDGPARLEAGGLIDGHVAVGIPEEDDLIDLELFDGSSDGSVVEFRLWKLLRLEAGLAGASVGVGPLDVGLGVLAYEPEPWVESGKQKKRKKVTHVHVETSETPESPAPRPTEADVQDAAD